MGSYKTRQIDEGYNSEMLSIMKSSPINANGLCLYFDKSPDIFFISRMKYSMGKHIGFFHNEELKGFGSAGYFDALIKGEQEKLFCFYNFYLLPEARGRNLSLVAFKEFLSDAKKNLVNYGIAITLKGNRSTEAYINYQPNDWIPQCRVVDELTIKTILFSKRIKNTTSYKVRNARLEDIPDIVKLLNQEHQQRDFGLVFNEEIFLSNLHKRALQIEDYYVATDSSERLKGVCLAWDCNFFRRTTVLKYVSEFYPYLLGYKTLAAVMPMVSFPKKGECFNELTITDYAVNERDPAIMHALLSEIYYRHHNKQYHFMNWGSCGSDPLLSAARGFWHKDISSHIAFLSIDPNRFNQKIQLPYIDIAFL